VANTAWWKIQVYLLLIDSITSISDMTSLLAEKYWRYHFIHWTVYIWQLFITEGCLSVCFSNKANYKILLQELSVNENCYSNHSSTYLTVIKCTHFSVLDLCNSDTNFVHLTTSWENIYPINHHISAKNWNSNVYSRVSIPPLTHTHTYTMMAYRFEPTTCLYNCQILAP
jgi:hypothetical protein